MQPLLMCGAEAGFTRLSRAKVVAQNSQFSVMPLHLLSLSVVTSEIA